MAKERLPDGYPFVPPDEHEKAHVQDWTHDNDCRMMTEIDCNAELYPEMSREAVRRARMSRIRRDAHALLNSDFSDNEDYPYIRA